MATFMNLKIGDSVRATKNLLVDNGATVELHIPIGSYGKVLCCHELNDSDTLACIVEFDVDGKMKARQIWDEVELTKM